MSTLSINGIKLAYDNVGQGEPLLLIHGIYSSRRQWVPQVAQLKSKYRVITCDLRGHGQSSASTDSYSVKLFADDLVAMLDELGIDRVICCGHSFGGLVAQEMAISHPERVRGIILAETMYGVSSTPWEAAWSTWMNIWLPQTLGVENYVKMIAYFFGMYTPEGAAYIMSEAERHLTDQQNQQNIMQASLKFDSRWRLHQITCPTLLLVGQLPHVPLIWLHNWEMYWRIGYAKLTFIPHAGHMLFWDNPDAFNQAIDDFVAELNHV